VDCSTVVTHVLSHTSDGRLAVAPARSHIERSAAAEPVSTAVKYGSSAVHNLTLDNVDYVVLPVNQQVLQFSTLINAQRLVAVLLVAAPSGLRLGRFSERPVFAFAQSPAQVDVVAAVQVDVLVVGVGRQRRLCD
jgi:hypothetical protein